MIKIIMSSHSYADDTQLYIFFSDGVQTNELHCLTLSAECLSRTEQRQDINTGPGSESQR